MDHTDGGYLPWSAAMDRALYGPAGFFRRLEGPAGHFRTSVHASPLFAGAVLRLLRLVDEALERPAELALIDVGAGRAELLTAILGELDGSPRDDGLRSRLRLTAVELADRPEGLPAQIEWSARPPAGSTGLLIANEWLDNVPCDVVELGPLGPRLVEVAPDGTERLGAEPDRSQQAWLECWWPGWDDREPGGRAELGLMRDAAWAEAVGSLGRPRRRRRLRAHRRDPPALRQPDRVQARPGGHARARRLVRPDRARRAGLLRGGRVLGRGLDPDARAARRAAPPRRVRQAP